MQPTALINYTGDRSCFSVGKAHLVFYLGYIWIPFLLVFRLQFKELERGKYSWNL